jgi:hypothetical protein
MSYVTKNAYLLFAQDVVHFLASVQTYTAAEYLKKLLQNEEIKVYSCDLRSLSGQSDDTQTSTATTARSEGRGQFTLTSARTNFF